MGTSNLYGGPKKTILLPSDYNPDNGSIEDNSQVNPSENPKVETPEINPTDGVQKGQQSYSAQSISWGEVRKSMTHAMTHRSEYSVKRAINNYTKALGGHSNAAKQAKVAKTIVGEILTYFTGTPKTIKFRLEDAGVSFNGRPTKEILFDICGMIAPIPNDLENSLSNNAINETFADIACDDNIDLNELDSFNEKLLQSIVGGFLKHYIYDKLIQQTEQGALRKCDDTTKLDNLEKDIKQYIDGIVDGVVNEIVYPGMKSEDFNRAVDTLFDVSYQQMEEL